VFGVITFLLLFGIWIILSGKFDLFHLTLGVISSIFIARLSHNLLFQDKGKPIGKLIGEIFRFAYYTIWLLYQIFLANLHVLGLALSLKPLDRGLDPHILTFKTTLKGNFARFVLANSITLTPGTVTIRIHEDVFFVHAISQKAAGDLPGEESVSEMEKRIAWIFEDRKK